MAIKQTKKGKQPLANPNQSKRLQPPPSANCEEITPEQMEKDITDSKVPKKMLNKVVKKTKKVTKVPEVLNKVNKKVEKTSKKATKVSKKQTNVTKGNITPKEIKDPDVLFGTVKAPDKTEQPSKKDGVYNPTPNSSGASPVEHNLGNGLTMLIDAQSSFKPVYCQKLVEHMRNGDSFYTFGFTVGVGRATLYHWLTKFPIFKDAYDLAWCGCLKFYEDLFKYDTLGLEPNMTGPDGNKLKLNKLKSDNLKYTLSRRFKEVYAEKQEIEAKTTSFDGNVDISQLTGEALDKRQKDLESQLAGTAKLIATLAGPNPLEEGNT